MIEAQNQVPKKNFSRKTNCTVIQREELDSRILKSSKFINKIKNKVESSASYHSVSI